ncbi:cbb3-type cytochrome c oxidase subunit I [Deinococcus yavapaiensis]|uniref:cytochrome-c oxidase n=1 Tax=Deinococcus yavapaiensis KR-236 TaxID=694435 RepID=A0A318S790_9DEIO|nr:cbb3-type cytochrome c oxidase subunit I [Deinococcus yavapaiensis]PYE52909.1 cytochrome c oxidase subunit I+III [Deinococcus yavapaiensis KR-236]
MAVIAPQPSRARPSIISVLWDYMTTTDHKKIGILYLLTSVIGFALAGVLAMAIRLQLAVPNNTVLVGQTYNEVLTAHGALMIFFFLIPAGLFGFGNFLLPLQLGVRDVALPRLNNFAVWLFVFSAILLVTSLWNGGGPGVGWTFYYPLSVTQQGTSIETLMIALILNGIGSLLGSANFAATILNLRAPGMGLWKMPIFTWSIFATAILQLLSLGGLTAASLVTYMELKMGLTMFNPAIGGVPILFTQFFWFYSHPAVYVMLLPYLGIAAEIASTFSRKPLFGYRVMVYSLMGITLASLLVWVHHIFAVGLPQSWQFAFALFTLIVAVPTGVKIFNIIGTMWGGRLMMRAPLYWLIGFVFNFLVGGITGVSLGMVPFDYQVTNSYYIVAHFHNVMMFGTAFMVFAGLYYWWPKMTGRFMDERLGKMHFWLFMIGSWVTFLPQYLLGLLGMPRRYYTYPDTNTLWNELNLISSIGVLFLAAGTIVMLWAMFASFRKPATLGPNPWGGYTLEWTAASPPAAYNFAHDFPRTFPTERPLYDWEQQGMKLKPVDPASIHLPQSSFWPFSSALALLITGYGLSHGWMNSGFRSLPDAINTIALYGGALYLVYSLFRWAGTFEYDVPVHHHHLTKYNNGFLGMAWFIISEVSLFGVLIAGYVYLRVTGNAVPPVDRPAIWLAAVNTFLLVASSFVIHQAEQDHHKHKYTRFRLGLFITLLLGSLFFLIQTYEFVHFGSEVDWRQNLWTSCFFLLVGLHGLHIIIGGVGVAMAYYQAMTGKIDKYNHGSIEPASLYWHLVDVVWIGILALFYIW